MYSELFITYNMTTKMFEISIIKYLSRDIKIKILNEL